MDDITLEKLLPPATETSFFPIVEKLCQRYGIDKPTLEYDGQLLSDVEQKFNIDCVFFIHHISLSLSHIYQSKIIVALEQYNYQLLTCEQYTKAQQQSLVEYFTDHGFEFKGWLFDHWLEYIAVNTLLFRKTMHVPTVPVTYPLNIQNDVVVNDICASSFDRFMNPIRRDFYSFNLEMNKEILIGGDIDTNINTGLDIDIGDHF